MEKISAKRITFIVSSKFHQEIKQRALNRGITMTRYIHKSIWEQIKKELSYEEMSGNHEPYEYKTCLNDNK